ncbi:serine/threonine protein kinase [Echinimonas agarilytica]|uniref:Stress response kinase A n=1 Tax=Echinimonas agarilytica TaxID=1215918 RepID=A0AA42B5X7_9GAMM|nr:serine/threonine protein kinase [Echinimonas agarilytica]MCM2678187.1 serine/threonine protein kinase [Echinimonas agarilytica]
MASFDFSGLSPDTILDALESVGIRAESGLLALNSYENRVYQLLAEDQRRYVVKFYRPARWSLEQIREEHAFAHDLADADVPVVAPLKFNGESLLQWQDFWFTVYPSVGGRTFDGDDYDGLERIGQQLGRLHEVGARSLFEHRPAIDMSMLNNGLEIIRSQAEIPSHIDQAFHTTLDALASAVAERMQGMCDLPQLRLHGDAHLGNILIRDQEVNFVDLDDSRNGPAIQDIWMFLSGERDQQLTQLDALVEGYEVFRSFDHKQLSLIEPMRGLRMIHYMGWLTQRWVDPAFPRSFTWFNTMRYWEEQILAMKEQIAALDERPLSLLPDVSW